MLTEVIDTLVLQSHAVEHPGRGLCHTGVVVALTGLQGRSFHDDATNPVKGHEIGKLQPIAEGA